ncbi:hypothetical protein FACHB389_20405, partial [Nostoc calcicola FACHB-389]
MIVNISSYEIEGVIKLNIEEPLKQLLNKQKELKHSQNRLAQIQLVLKQNFIAPKTNEISKFQKLLIVLQKEGVSKVFQKVIAKTTQKLDRSTLGLTNSTNIQKYTVLETPQKIKFQFPECPFPQVSIIIPVYFWMFVELVRPR